MDIDIVNWTPARMGWTGLDIKPVWRGLDWAGLCWAGWAGHCHHRHAGNSDTGP